MSKIAKLIIKDGQSAMGSQVELEDGSKLSGIQAIQLASSVDQPTWRMTVDVCPGFIDQLPFGVELVAINIGNLSDLTDEQLEKIGLQRIKD